MGNAVKVLGITDDAYRIGGYGVVFGGVDLDGESFTPDTDYQLQLVPAKPIYYDHAAQIKTPLGVTVETKHDEMGLWVEGELSRANQYADYVMALIHAGKLGWSSGSVAHLAQREGGIIKSWPIVEFSLTPTPAEPRTLGVSELKSMLADLPGLEGVIAAEETHIQEVKNMEQEVKQEQAQVAPQPDNTAAILDAIKALAGQVDGMQKEVAAVKAMQTEADKKAVNDPLVAPNVIMDADHWKYDNLDAGELAWAIGTLGEAKASGRSRRGPSAPMFKALAMRLESDEVKGSEPLTVASRAMKSAGIKANELNYSTQANYGDEWVGVAYSGDLWEKIRAETFVLNRLPTIEVPAGAESVVLPLESTDPTWYKVAQSTALTANPGAYSGAINSVTASKLGTAQTSLTLAKMGARVLWTGEMEEDSFVPFVSQLRNQLIVSGAEYLEHVIIDGDTATDASTNINDIAGTPGGTEAFLLVNGFRKLPLVTLTANSRDGGALDVADFLETVKLMGTGGIAGYDQGRVAFIVDRMTHYKALELADVKTRDVFNGATIEGGRLASIWGYPVFMSAQLARLTNGLTNTAGKSDLDTAGNNTKGQILAVRWDRWRFGWRRRMTIETTRIPAADATEIVALMRFGLIYSAADDAAAITYNLTV